jgi:predicted nucleic acid-binding protein
LLLDSNVLIDVLRGEQAALHWLESQRGDLATARIHGCLLVTRNTRDFPESLEGVLMPYAI